MTYSKFCNQVENFYNCDLTTAIFDKSVCESCSSNTASLYLFVNELEKINCFNKGCFLKKERNYKICKAKTLLKQNLTYIITKAYSNEWFILALKEKGYEIADIRSVSSTAKNANCSRRTEKK